MKVCRLPAGVQILSENSGKRMMSAEIIKKQRENVRENMKKSRKRFRDTFRDCHGRNAGELIDKLERDMKLTARELCGSGVGNDYRTLDYYLYEKTVRFLKRMHPKKSRAWIYERYFKKDRKNENRMVFTDPASGRQLKRMVDICRSCIES